MCFSCTSAAHLHTPSAVDLTSVFRRAASSTWLIAGVGETGPVGFTATTLVQVSNTPPLVSFNIAKTAPYLPAIRDSRWAAAHLLDAHQGALATRFASGHPSSFADDGSWRYDDRGLPQIKDACARLIISVRELFDAGDSLVALADVRSGSIGSARPLLHHRGGFVPATT